MENLGFLPTAIDAPERWSVWSSLGISTLLGPLPLLTELKDVLPGERIPVKAEPTTDPAAASPKVVPAPGERKQTGQSPSNQTLPRFTDPFPEHWQQAFGKTVFGRPLLWTYPELGQDLFGIPGTERREILRQLLGQLNMGSVHNFWPFTEFGSAADFTLRLDFFEQGFYRLSPKCVVFLGSGLAEPVTEITDPSPFTVSFSTKLKVMCLFIPEISQLYTQPQLLSRTLAFLQTKLPAYIGV